MDFQEIYRQKLKTAQQAVSVIKSGDWVDYGWAITTPVACDQALSERIKDLQDVKLRGGILLQVPQVFQIETPAPHVSW